MKDYVNYEKDADMEAINELCSKYTLEELEAACEKIKKESTNTNA